MRKGWVCEGRTGKQKEGRKEGEREEKEVKEKWVKRGEKREKRN